MSEEKKMTYGEREVLLGDRVIVFDGAEWTRVGHDVGDNSRFFKLADVVDLRHDNHGRRIADVRYVASGQLSRGHFVSGLFVSASRQPSPEGERRIEGWALMMPDGSAPHIYDDKAQAEWVASGPLREAMAKVVPAVVILREPPTERAREEES